MKSELMPIIIMEIILTCKIETNLQHNFCCPARRYDSSAVPAVGYSGRFAPSAAGSAAPAL